MAKRRGMSKRRGSRRSRTIKNRSKYHQGRKRSRVGRMRRGRRRMSRRMKRGGSEPSAKSQRGQTGQVVKKEVIVPKLIPMLLPPKVPESLQEFIQDIGNSIDYIMDINTPRWNATTGQWKPGGNMDYGYINLKALAHYCISNQVLENIMNKPNAFDTERGPETQKYKKTFGDCIIVMCLSSSEMLDRLVSFSENVAYKDKLTRILSFKSSRDKYPLDNLKTIGGAAYDADHSWQVNAAAEGDWCKFLNSITTGEWEGKEFYSIKRIKDVTGKIDRIIQNCNLSQTQEGEPSPVCAQYYKARDKLPTDGQNKYSTC